MLAVRGTGDAIQEWSGTAETYPPLKCFNETSFV